MKEQQLQPKRSLLFVAWCGAQRYRALDYAHFLKAHMGYEGNLEIVAGIEVEGVGAGSGSSAVVWHSTRERLTQVLLRSARRVRTPINTRLAGLHAESEVWPGPATAVPSVTLSWAGSDDVSGLPTDNAAGLDPDKLGGAGRAATLAVMVLSQDLTY